MPAATKAIGTTGATSEAGSVRECAGGRSGFSVCLLALLLLPALAFAQSAAGKVGYVDLKRLIDNAPQMIASRAQLQKQFAPRDTALKADQAHLAQLQTKYARDSAIISQSDADALKRQIDTLDRSIKRNRESMRDELNLRATAERDRIWQQINNAVVEYARSEGFDLIVPSPVVYASPRIDITDAVLERLRHAKPAASAKP